MAIKSIAGIIWQKLPVMKNIAVPGHENWVVWGVQRVEVPGTGGWQHAEKTVYLQGDGSWDKAGYFFISKEKADAVLADALGEQAEPIPISAFAAAFQRVMNSK